MKTLILLVLAVIGAHSAVIQPTTRANLIVGGIGSGDRLLTRTNVYRGPIANSIQTQDVVYRGNATTRITAVQAIEIGSTQWASAFIINGGVGRNNVTVRFQSARGWGFNYQLSIWGR